MTRKHFIKMAEVAKQYFDKGETEAAYAIFLAVVSANDNKLFDVRKFKVACGLNPDYQGAF